MKNPKYQSCILTAAVLTISLFLISSTAMRASESMDSCMPPKWCAEMVKMHEDFLKMLKTQDNELATQVEKMKDAPADQKTVQIEATLSLLIQQQSAQHSEMEKMIGQTKDILGKNKCRMMKDSD